MSNAYIFAEQHPDTIRLNHLLMMDHEILEMSADGTRVERLCFIYDANNGRTPLENLRTAIDRSIAARKNAIRNNLKQIITPKSIEHSRPTEEAT